MHRKQCILNIGRHKLAAVEVNDMSFDASEQDKLERFVNGFGTQSFRDQADRDYIAARLACRHELFPQFLWSSHQAIEKYLKAILLYNRIKANQVGHDLA